MSRFFDLRASWNTVWSGVDILVLRNDIEVDRIHAPHILRIVFVQPSPAAVDGAPNFALVELADEFVVFPAATSLAIRVHFERQSFWAAKSCTYWADVAAAPLPPRCLPRRGFGLKRREPCYMRLRRAEMAPLLDRWVLEGPQSWEERRWRGAEERRARTHPGADTRPGYAARHAEQV